MRTMYERHNITYNTYKRTEWNLFALIVHRVPIVPIVISAVMFYGQVIV